VGGLLLPVVDAAMLPVIGSPGVVEEFAGFFRRIFSWHQFRRFKQYLSGLITGGKATVRHIASRLVEHADQSSLNRFLTLYEWDEERLNGERLDLLQSLEETNWRREGVVAIDDTLLQEGEEDARSGQALRPQLRALCPRSVPRHEPLRRSG
jgi:hypothetical protein